MTKITLMNNRFTMIYYNVMVDLKINYEEYLILERMLHRSKSSTYSEGVTSLARYLGFERATIYKIIKNLIQKEYIEHYDFGKPYFLTYNIKEAFDEKNGNYLKIYHAHRSKHKLSIKQYAMLYLIFSFSKNRINRVAFAGITRYCTILDISRSYYNNITSNFLSKGFLVTTGNHHLKLSDEIFRWFSDQEKTESV